MKCAIERHALEHPMKAFVDLSDDCVLTFTCEKGHENSFALQEQKFEILVEMGGMAILDGYYREAVASMAVALERFFEFYIRAVCLGRGIAHDQLPLAWKAVVNQSERQLGAFMFLYLLETGKPFELVEKMVKFRNTVTHRGYLPSRAEALKYARWAFNSIRDLGSWLKDKHDDASGRVVAIEIGERGKKHRLAGKNIGTSYHGMMLSWPQESWRTTDFDHELKDLADRRWLIWAGPDGDELLKGGV
jgi:hypothetical protein